MCARINRNSKMRILIYLGILPTIFYLTFLCVPPLFRRDLVLHVPVRDVLVFFFAVLLALRPVQLHHWLETSHKTTLLSKFLTIQSRSITISRFRPPTSPSFFSLFRSFSLSTFLPSFAEIKIESFINFRNKPSISSFSFWILWAISSSLFPV